MQALKIIPKHSFPLHSEKKKVSTTLQSKTNAKHSKQWFKPYHETGFVKTIPTLPHNLCVRFEAFPFTNRNRISQSRDMLSSLTFFAGCCWHCLDEPVPMTGPKSLLSELGIHYRLKICGGIW